MKVSKDQIISQSFKKKLDDVSSSFCLAKWIQSTVHLQNGQTHSCHLPSTHFIPLEELKSNPTALHNTQYKKKQRAKMLNGERPKECHYCWNIEDTDSDSLSDRYIKSSLPWAKPFFNEVVKCGSDGNINPRYLEVSFSSTCNFRCCYCWPHISSSIFSEIKKHGTYQTSEGVDQKTFEEIQQSIHNIDDNPYVAAFWKWWPELYTNLEVLRITGGEPLLDENTFKVLDYIIERPNENLSLAINSNLGVGEKKINRLIEKLNKIANKKKVKAIRLYTSLDAYGEQAEYIRHGLNYQEVINNIELLFEKIPSLKITIISTFNALSVMSYQKLLDQVLVWRERYRLVDGRDRFSIDIPYLNFPEYQSVKILPETFLPYIDNLVLYMEQNYRPDDVFEKGFLSIEIEKMKRIRELIKSPKDQEWQKEARRNFYRFFKEYDFRKQLDFKKIFPEYELFWNECVTLCEEVEDRKLNVKTFLLWNRRDVLKLEKSLRFQDNELVDFIEVAFSNKCDLKCTYCYPHKSSALLKELKNPTALTQIKKKYYEIDYLNDQDFLSKTVDSENGITLFWKWLEKNCGNLKKIKILGGEPLSESYVLQMITFLEKRNLLNVELEIDTSLQVSKEKLEQFVDKINFYFKKINIGKCWLNVSIDSLSEQQEYLRDGWSYDLFLDNLDFLCKKIEKFQIVFKCRLNILSALNIENYFETILNLREKYGVFEGHGFSLYISYLEDPAFLSVKILPENKIIELEKTLEKILEGNNLLSLEKKGVEKVLKWLERRGQNENLDSYRKDFYLFFNEKDKARSKKFLDIFSEYKTFWTTCKQKSELNYLKNSIENSFRDDEKISLSLQNGHCALENEDKSKLLILGEHCFDQLVPKKLELGFSNECNISCSYCSPQNSCALEKELKANGIYNIDECEHHPAYIKREKLETFAEKENPFMKHFWEWFPKIYEGLDELIITGGEPLLSDNFYLMLEFISKNSNPNLKLSIFTGLGVNTEKFEKFCGHYKNILNSHKKIKLYLSIDTCGKDLEYIRHGLKYEKFLSHMKNLCELFPQQQIIITNTVSVLSVPSMKNFLEEFLFWRKEYGLERFSLIMKELESPSFQSIKLMLPEVESDITEALDFMKDNVLWNGVGDNGFLVDEVKQLEDIYNTLKIAPDKKWLKNARNNFYNFYSERDRRYKTDFRKTFPKYKDFFSKYRVLFSRSVI